MDPIRAMKMKKKKGKRKKNEIGPVEDIKRCVIRFLKSRSTEIYLWQILFRCWGSFKYDEIFRLFIEYNEVILQLFETYK